MENTTVNDPRNAGQETGQSEVFGPWDRYRVFEVHSRFDSTSWFVEDAERIDEETGLLLVAAIEDTKQAAMAVVLNHPAKYYRQHVHTV
jgi:hypothetical protein